MKYKITFILLFLTLGFSFGQTKLAELTFENPGGYSTTIPEFTDQATQEGWDYFIRTDGSNISNENFLNIQGTYYFAAQDIDGEGATLPATLLLDNVNISGYSNIQFRVHLAEDDDGTNQDWDNQDYVHFNYDIDNTGVFTNLLWIENDGPGGNREPLIDSDFNGIGDGTAITNTFTQFTQNITGTGALLDIEIVLSLDDGDEDIAIDNIEIWGTLIPCTSTVSWNGAWVGGTPDLTTNAILDAPYDTATNGGSFQACSLTINTGTLTIGNGYSVEVQNDITVIAGTGINVQAQGSLVQNNDNALFTDNSANGVSLTKTKQMQNSISYTYWSSPVLGETIENTFGTTPIDRRYQFIAANFVDNDTEIGNTGTFNFGTPDDIDDDGNDWQLMSTGTMLPGIGYTTMPSSIVGPGGYPSNQSFIFTGAFNNGGITVPIVNASGGIYNDWNFVGNPYPSAISVDQFFSVNAGLVDVIYLWDQATPPDANSGGSQGSNFSNDDYAIINGTGEIGARGDTGAPPNRYIASGQGFFIEALQAGLISFNNSMRVPNNNTQFYRTSNKKTNSSTLDDDKLWINLSSDNGVSNQILIGYLEGATANADATYYDAPRNLSTNASAILYSNIKNSLKKFAIQGKAPSNLTDDEIISIGYKTSIDVPTIYSLSIAQIEGDFLNNSPIYIKDNLLNKLHDLKTGDYNFTSEVGEFNNRFEIVFNQAALSIGDIAIDDYALSIIELNNGDVQFKLNATNNISNIKIIDLQGRILYNFKVDSKDETLNLSNLSQAPYIAKITLDNNLVITKKAIKKY
ncbi:T9SS type A sorting domain-containing protein [Flavobacteriaceae bacterium S0862]|nr:T9SS type A sorting domain-containing protein [Flavobacteriaceae bacterium S0862]